MKPMSIAMAMAVALWWMAMPVRGAIIINSGNVGYGFTIDYAGQVNGQAAPSVSALGNFTYTGLSNSGLTYNFNYSLANDSTTTARLSGFAFNTTPDPTNVAITGAFNQANSNGGNYPEGFGSVDFCFSDGGGSCAGGGNGGYYQGNTGTGTFSLTFAQMMTSVTFDDFVTRFQSISGVNGGTSGIGIGSVVQGGTPITAPEPMSWLMMLTGFGLIGWTLRRRTAIYMTTGRSSA